MQELFLPEIPAEEREQLMRDNCDEIVEKSYTRRYTQDEVNRVRAELADNYIELNELSSELDCIKAEYKAKMKPIIERNALHIKNLKAGGEYVTTECYKFVDEEENRVGFYDPQGHLLEERPIMPEEKTNIFRNVRQEALRIAQEENQKRAVVNS
ncbi:MAG: hypothetical protein ACI4TM_06700 [Candidatus Cryptobacteroides sp.]